MALFSLTLYLNSLWSTYLTAALLGLFMTGYLPVGFEFVAQVTRPVPEGTSSGLVNCCAQIFGLIFIPATGSIINHGHASTANTVLVVFLLIGLILTSKNIFFMTLRPYFLLEDDTQCTSSDAIVICLVFVKPKTIVEDLSPNSPTAKLS